VLARGDRRPPIDAAAGATGGPGTAEAAPE
jgi:hypothetical protein